MKALVFERKVPKFAAARVAGTFRPGAGAKVGPLRLKDVDPPELPGDDWVYVKPRLAGICGSDLATIDGTSSRYFEPIVSFPFTMGHEVVADLIDPANGITEADGTHRVVIEPVLGCVTRGISPVCDECARGNLGNCTNISFGDLEPGLQSGFCCDTGGGWSTMMIAHRSQLHAVPADLSDEAAVMVEPTACAIHAALAGPTAGAMRAVVVIGSGTLGLLTIAALRRFIQTDDDTQIIAVAKHPLQRRLARELGADVVVEPGEVRRAVRRVVGTMAIGDGNISRLTGGADRVLDCVGSSESITEALAVARPRGWVNLVGMAGAVEVDLTPLWHKELALVGAYAYGTEVIHDDEAAEDAPLDRRRTFDLAFELVRDTDLGRLVSATYPLGRFEDAVTHAATAGGRGAVKVAFDLRAEKERARL
jgi:threonine dehydrogenase-like Zn-dependent dehydrogenase